MSTNPPPPKDGTFLKLQQYERLLKLADETAQTSDIKVANRNGSEIARLLRTVARGEYT